MRVLVMVVCSMGMKGGLGIGIERVKQVEQVEMIIVRGKETRQYNTR